jgi:hypothetical protein
MLRNVGKTCINDMGISVSEYFAQKEACSDCLEHGDEEHCVTTLLSRAENCFVYNITHYGIGDYTEEQKKSLRDFRNNSTEEENVGYYVRCEKLIEKMDILNKPFYEQFSIYSAINHKHIKDVVKLLGEEKNEDVKHLINNMLDVLEKENDIPKELNDNDNY